MPISLSFCVPNTWAMRRSFQAAPKSLLPPFPEPDFIHIKTLRELCPKNPW